MGEQEANEAAQAAQAPTLTAVVSMTTVVAAGGLVAETVVDIVAAVVAAEIVAVAGVAVAVANESEMKIPSLSCPSLELEFWENISIHVIEKSVLRNRFKMTSAGFDMHNS